MVEDTKKTDQLIQEATEEHFEEPQNEAVVEGEVFESEAANSTVEESSSEGDVVTPLDEKSTWAESEQENMDSNAVAESEQNGSGAFEMARKSWMGNGWNV